MTSFAAEIDAWVLETEQRGTAVFRESSKRVIQDMQTPKGQGGRMPVDTGFLRASLQVSLNGSVPMATRENPGTQVAYDTGPLVATLATAKVGDVVVAGYTANYAVHREYGSKGQEPDAFVRTALSKWPSVVAQVTAEAKARSR